MGVAAHQEAARAPGLPSIRAETLTRPTTRAAIAASLRAQVFRRCGAARAPTRASVAANPRAKVFAQRGAAWPAARAAIAAKKLITASDFGPLAEDNGRFTRGRAKLTRRRQRWTACGASALPQTPREPWTSRASGMPTYVEVVDEH